MSLFGEINENCSTRSAFEDWDDEISEDTGDIVWSTPLEILDKIDIFYILEGQYLSDCVKAQSQNFIQRINSAPAENLKLYKLKSSNKYVCTLKNYNLLHSSKLVELLKPIIAKSLDILVLTTKPITEYQSINTRSQSCIVRKLNTSVTSKNFKEIKYKTLEQPNIITGVAAGVISLREHQSLAATAFVFYVEPNNIYEIEEVNRQLQDFNIIDIVAKVPNTIYNSNLYI